MFRVLRKMVSYWLFSVCVAEILFAEPKRSIGLCLCEEMADRESRPQRNILIVLLIVKHLLCYRVRYQTQQLSFPIKKIKGINKVNVTEIKCLKMIVNSLYLGIYSNVASIIIDSSLCLEESFVR